MESDAESGLERVGRVRWKERLSIRISGEAKITTKRVHQQSDFSGRIFQKKSQEL